MRTRLRVDTYAHATRLLTVTPLSSAAHTHTHTTPRLIDRPGTEHLHLSQPINQPTNQPRVVSLNLYESFTR